MINDAKKAQNLSEPVYQYLRDMILSSQLKPGEKIPEAKVATQFGISRTPIRDALKQLANDGIVNIYPNRFVEVASWDNETMTQLGVTRVILDNAVAKLAVFNGSNAEFSRLTKISEECLDAANSGDVVLRIKKDCEYHIELGIISKNSQLLEYQKNLYLKVQFFESFRTDDLLSPQKQHKHHCEIVEALMRRDSEEVVRLLTYHNIRYHGIGDEYPQEFFLNNI